MEPQPPLLMPTMPLNCSQQEKRTCPRHPIRKSSAQSIPPHPHCQQPVVISQAPLTSNDSCREVELNNACAEGCSHHAQGCEEATHKHDRPAAKAVHAYTTEWACREVATEVGWPSPPARLCPLQAHQEAKVTSSSPTACQYTLPDTTQQVFSSSRDQGPRGQAACGHWRPSLTHHRAHLRAPWCWSWRIYCQLRNSS